LADVLSQNEIEALLASMTATDEKPEDAPVPEGRRANPSPASAMPRKTEGKIILPLHKRRRAEAGLAIGDPRFASLGHGTISYEAYDFRRPDKLSKENLRSLQMLHETFSNHLASSLSGYLRAQVELEVVSVEQVRYEEYIKSMSVSLLNVLNVSPLNGQAILEVDFEMLFSMLDRLLGGTGNAGKIGRDLTDIEKLLSENIVQLALNDMKMAWDNIHPLDFEVASMDTSSQFVQIVPGNDTVVLVLMEMTMGDHRGAMSMCIPYLLIKPILSKLSAQRWLTNTSKKPSPLHAAGLADRLRTTRVPCIARLGTTDLTVDEITALHVGQILSMSVPLSSQEQDGDGKGRIGMVDVLIGDHVKFRGKTGLRGKNLAVQIEQVVTPQPDLVSHKETT
jgi:flagellar motor switch protein FliM